MYVSVQLETKRFNKNHNEVSVLFAKFTNSGHTFAPHDGGGSGAGGAGGAQSLLCVVRTRATAAGGKAL